MLLAVLLHPHGAQTVDRGGNFVLTRTSEVAGVALGTVEGVEAVQAVAVKEALDGFDRLAQGRPAVHEPPGHEVDGAADGPGLAVVHQLFDSPQVDVLGAEQDQVEGLGLDLNFTPSTRRS